MHNGMKSLTIAVCCSILFSFAARGKTVYVDPANYGKSGLDGSIDRPFGTIQDAIDAESTEVDSVIELAPGIYTNGMHRGTGLDSSYARVVINKRLTITGRPGHREDTIILGDRGSTENGLGDDAVRCVYNANGANSVIRGITLTGGYTGSSGAPNGQGGAVCSQKNTFVIDCIVTNNFAYRSGAFMNGNVMRCYVADNDVSNMGSVGQGVELSFCVLKDNSETSAKALTIYSGKIVNCTFVGNNGILLGTRTSGNWAYVYNSVFTESTKGYQTAAYVANDSFKNNVLRGTLVDGTGIDENNAKSVTALQVVDSSKGDWRLVWNSSATNRADAALLGELTVPEGYVIADYYGNPVDMTAERLHAGAVQSVQTRMVVTVNKPELGSLTVKGGSGTYGESVLLDGAQIAISSNLDRPFEGFLINGERCEPWATNLVLKATMTTNLTVAAVFGTNWYVSAVCGNDAWSGAYAANPRKTLSGIMLQNPLPGDVVHADAGTYSEPFMAGKVGSKDARATVVVPEGVRLVADKGATNTIIKGAADSGTQGLGENAVRCAILGSGAEIVGFTLTGGYTLNVKEDTGYGSAVYGTTASYPLVSDCVISNNFGYAYTLIYVKALRCRVVGNSAEYRGAAGHVTSWYGCLIGDNDSPDRQINYPNDFMHCTVYGQRLLNASSAPVNSIFIGGTVDGSKGATNCLFDATCKINDKTEALFNDGCGIGVDVKLDSSYYPKRNSCAVDHADPAYLLPILGDVDLLGHPRVVNGIPDIGAMEWMPKEGGLILIVR